MSQQAKTKGRQDWTAKVKEVANDQWNGDSLVLADVMVGITYFYRGGSQARSPIDVDNIPKPILDAMNQLVYVDDSQVTDLLCRKRNLDERISFDNTSEVVVEAVGEHDSFVHVVVREGRTQEVDPW